MMGAIDDIAGKLIEAAYEHFGRPPEPGGVYIATVTREVDVPAYFREVVKLAREPRSRALWERTREFFDSDAAMVMEAGLKRLSQDAALAPEERSVLEEIEAFEKWRSAIEDEIIAELNRISMQAGEVGGSKR